MNLAECKKRKRKRFISFILLHLCSIPKNIKKKTKKNKWSPDVMTMIKFMLATFGYCFIYIAPLLNSRSLTKVARLTIH